jgi:hypothetical protein
MSTINIFAGEATMKELKDGYIVLVSGMGTLSVLGVVSSQDEAERLAKQQVEQSQGNWKAYVLRISAAYEVS